MAIFVIKMIIRTAEYVGSFVRYDQGPDKTLPEFAFIGRSNVGKSSLINFLTERRELAKVSKQPGKTQTINYFIVNDEWYLVDLPGYGYAKHSKKTRAKWGTMIQNYLAKRSTLTMAFILIDANIPPQKIDLEFIEWLGENRVPFSIVFTKSDKSKSKAIKENLEAFEATLHLQWEPLPNRFVTSSIKRLGREPLLDYIAEIYATVVYDS